MGWIARRRERQVESIAKAIAPTILTAARESQAAPAGVVVDAVPLVSAIAEGQQAGYVGPTEGKVRDPSALEWQEPYTGFGPGVPIAPVPFDPRLPETGRALPRRYEFPVSWNLPGGGQPLTPFNVLRRFADQVDIARLCIGVRKKELSSMGWSISVKEELVHSIAQDQDMTPGRARVAALNERKADIDRLTQFFTKPDRINRLTFSEWMYQLLEEVFVLDALSIYPHPDRVGRLHSLEILDGATIKPLLDHRGAFPQPPQPAFQQILWAFPRGEFHLSDDTEETMTSDELIYRPRERRSWTPYGFSATEQALIAGDLYMKRQQWLRSEYSDGAVPAALMVPSAAQAWTPQQVRDYESLINAELAGQTEQRKRWRLTPPDVKLEFPGDWSERYNSNLDEYLIKLICAFYDVMPSEIGFTPKSGLGGAGHQEGEAASVTRIGNKPMLEWIADILNDIMQTYLGAPPELTFSFDLDESEDAKVKSEVAKSDISIGKRTLNDTRAEDGLPLYDFEEADEPFIVTPTGPVFIKGMLEQHTASIEASVAGSQQSVGISNGSIEDPKVTAAKLHAEAGFPPGEGKVEPKGVDAPSPKKEDEIKKFVRYAERRKGKAWRDFEFVNDTPSANTLNEWGAEGRLDLIKAVAADMGKASSVQYEWVLGDGGSSGNCDLCDENADASPLDWQDEWPNGEPPVHPNCDCSIETVINVEEVDGEELSGEGFDVEE